MMAHNAERLKRKSTKIVISKAEELKELMILDDILVTEESHGQWYKHGLCFFVLISQVCVNLIRGSKSNPSKIPGYAKC